eukprot:TRINITY_DN3248_c0_g2_i1.p1 TRINITY_DN3248_c0_g2~~TRINITY_DN3248_c0_g2_i1.p1  ORF type:complete len:126 (+),score=35.70 TRINITY_DN3248_c0_g2_i1:44-379(+)
MSDVECMKGAARRTRQENRRHKWDDLRQWNRCHPDRGYVSWSREQDRLPADLYHKQFGPATFRYKPKKSTKGREKAVQGKYPTKYMGVQVTRMMHRGGADLDCQVLDYNIL